MMTDFAPVFPLDYPTLSLRFYQQSNGGIAYRWVGKAVFLAYKSMIKAPQRLTLLRKSRAYFLLWHATHDGLYVLVRWLEQRYYHAVVGSIREQTGYQVTREEQQNIKVKRWRHYTLLQSRMLDREHKKAFIFLQPNQYLKNSKPLSEEEKRIAINESLVAPFHMGMVQLKTHLAEMQHTKLPIFDLTDIFSSTTQTVYQDSCCHLNDLGNQIMADTVLRTIVQNW